MVRGIRCTHWPRANARVAGGCYILSVAGRSRVAGTACWIRRKHMTGSAVSIMARVYYRKESIIIENYIITRRRCAYVGIDRGVTVIFTVYIVRMDPECRRSVIDFNSPLLNLTASDGCSVTVMRLN